MNNYESYRMQRFFDFVFSAIALIITLPLLLVIYLIALTDTGSPLFFQVRVGRRQRPFTLIKFRTMRPETISTATHLVDPKSVTKLGSFLRSTKLDELPQLWNVLKGDMSLVGPRPCLFNQDELILERALLDVFSVRPGITGRAQINHIDMSTPSLLAMTDAQMINSLSVISYFGYILATILGKGKGDRLQKSTSLDE